jgi:hypothetical protein
MRTLLLLSLSLSSVALAQSSIFPTKQELDAARKLEPDAINDAARRFLKSKMKGHAKDMKDVSVAVATVNFPAVARTAQLIANQPRLDPATGPAASLPQGFFAMQDLLKRSAQGLADSAREENLDQMVEQYQYTVTVCAACHVAFVPAKQPKK